MTKQFRYSTWLFLMILFILGTSIHKGWAQTTDVKIKGVVLESGTGLPLKQVLVSVSSTGVSTETDENGSFSINVPNKQVEITVDLPGYNKRNIFLLGRDSVTISMVASKYKSFDNSYNTPRGTAQLKDASYAVSALRAEDLDLSKATSFDTKIQGQVSGLRVIEHSGMPGSRTWMNIGGISSMYGKNQPLLFIDGMIHDYEYTNISLIEGFSLNPLDVIDIEDISDITVLKNGNAYLGGVGSNGIVNINTEQESEASTVIKVSGYYGITMVPKSQEVLGTSEYRDYLREVNAPYSWVNGTVPPKYNNSTDWQKEIFAPGTLQKVHMFLKGGDDIATYNISTGYVKQNSIYEKANFSRFNLRINGKVNITDKFSVAPNAKLSLADSYLPNQGFSVYKNPLLSAHAMPPIMSVYARDVSTGVRLPFLDDVGDINVSNPVAITENAIGTNRNYNFLSSVNAIYKISPHFRISNLVGIDFNNSRESIFLPNLGLFQTDSAYNSPGDLSSEYRSTQNHTTITYSDQFATSSLEINGGMRVMKNSYKDVKLIDLNTAGDEFKNLGAGTGSLSYLRSTTGEDRGLIWLSYFGNLSYSIKNTYFLNANLSYDASSSILGDNKYNLYPSLGLGWRVSSLMPQSSWLEDLKLRGSWSQTGNIFSSVYDYSKLYYFDVRYVNFGVLNREAIPNNKMEIEKKSTINLGVDVSMFRQTTNLHVDYYISNVDNLIIAQRISDSYGYTNYFDNGGKLKNTGIEISADQRIHFGELVWTLNASITTQTNEITGLKFINNNYQKNIVTKAEVAEFITSVGNAVNSFYGYKTNGIYNNASEANSVIGPKGLPMQAGDIRFVDANGDNKIDEADKTIIGNPNPEFFGGFSSLFSFKGLELLAYFTYSIGNEAFNYVKYKGESMDSYSNQFKSVTDRWTGSNNNTTMPRFSLNDPTGNNSFSDRWIEDASFFRLKQLTLSYTFSGKRLYKGITVYGTASNLLTFTKYSGYDPEFMYLNSPFVMGIDYGAIPQTSSFILGLKLDL